MTDRSEWNARHAAAAHHEIGTPSAWVMRHAALLPPGALVLDVAAGRGRHALALAALGHTVIALDVSEVAMRQLASRHEPRIRAVVGDGRALPFANGAFDALVCVNFLDRELFVHHARWLRSSGVFIAETFTTQQRTLGRGPRSDAHLLEPDELPTLVAPSRVVEHREGLVLDTAGERYVAGVVAVK